MAFALLSIGMVVFIVLILVLLARSYPGSGADLLDWKPTRDYATEVQLEQDDIKQMIAAQNAYRRRRGAEELTEMDAERMAREDQQVRERGRMDEDSFRKLDGHLRKREPEDD
jgi:hypothetical protein